MNTEPAHPVVPADVSRVQRRCGGASTFMLMTIGGCLAALGFATGMLSPAPRPDAPAVARETTDAAAAKEAFLAAYTVFMHARCVNCHPMGDAPLQGDHGEPHAQNVKRGKDGKGKYALKCSNCHQDTNTPGENMPPGTPAWHLPPPEMKMVFEGLSPGELCRQLKDPALNGGKTLEQLITHVSEDKLVLWGWEPGDGRSKPPMSHEEFVRKVRAWVENGAACPD